MHAEAFFKARPRLPMNFPRSLLVCLAIALSLATMGARGAAKAEDGKMKVDGAQLDIRIPARTPKPAQKIIRNWIRKSAEAVIVYYGRFPVERVTIYVNTSMGRGVSGGRAFGGSEPYITITAGLLSTPQDFARDWRMVHEMIHMAFPMIHRRHNWMTEGLAVYVESIARLQAEHLTAATIWKGFVDGMKNGLPRTGDKGLDHTPTWGRTYWGGAIFCLVADIEIRQRTAGKMSLQDALRAVLASGGDYTKGLAARTRSESRRCCNRNHGSNGPLPEMAGNPS